ncbi:MAG: diguanylate cyclase [bacterium]|nr:diguanylate cyclase [bacterium]
MSDFEQEPDLSRQSYIDLEKRFLHLQKEQTRLQRETKHTRMLAGLIQAAYRIANSEVSIEELCRQFLQVVLETLDADRAKLFMYVPEERSIIAQYALEVEQKTPAAFSITEVPRADDGANPDSTPDALIDALGQVAESPYLIWAFGSQTGIALLVGNATEGPPLHPPFEEDDRGIIEGALIVFVETIERKRAEGELRTYRDQLAELVNVRTTELTKANKHLRQEIMGRKQVEESLHRRNQELGLLNQVTHMFNSTLDLDRTLATVLDEMCRLLHIAAASFWLLTPATGEFICRQAVGPGSDTVIGWPLSLGQGIAGKAAQTGEIVHVRDTRADKQHYKGVDKKIGVEFRSILSLPFQAKGTVIGVLNLVDTVANSFTEDDLRLVESIATVAANAIEKAHLYMAAQQEIAERKRVEKMMQRHNRDLTFLNQMNTLLQKCHAEDETYTVLNNMCQQIFASDSGWIFLLNTEQPMLEVVGSWNGPAPEAQIIDHYRESAHGKTYVLESPDSTPLHLYLNPAPDDGYPCAIRGTSGEILGIFFAAFSQPEPDSSVEQSDQIRASKQLMATRITEQYALFLTNLRLREALRREAIRDPLTGLFNRRYMEEALVREVRRAKRNTTSVGIMMLDVDHFKAFNDTHGHKTGDVVLQELGKLLERMIRGGDIACRYGGEEFLVILAGTTLETTELRAEELLWQIRALSITSQNATLSITASLGIAVLPIHGSDIQSVVSAADAALYEAKRRGRNQAVVASQE